MNKEEYRNFLREENKYGYNLAKKLANKLTKEELQAIIACSTLSYITTSDYFSRYIDSIISKYLTKSEIDEFLRRDAPEGFLDYFVEKFKNDIITSERDKGFMIRELDNILNKYKFNYEFSERINKIKANFSLLKS